jgi:hypothetical protein
MLIVIIKYELNVMNKKKLCLNKRHAWKTRTILASQHVRKLSFYTVQFIYANTVCMVQSVVNDNTLQQVSWLFHISKLVLFRYVAQLEFSCCLAELLLISCSTDGKYNIFTE